MAKPFPAAGTSWNDHEFFTLGTGHAFPSWDWFSIQLDDRSSLLLYGLRLPNGQYDPASRGTYIAADGKVTHLHRGDFTLTPETTCTATPVAPITRFPGRSAFPNQRKP